MFYNSLSLLALGFLIEPRISDLNFILICFFAGSAGTFASTFTTPAPYNLGTGGSQAVLALAAVGIVLPVSGKLRSKGGYSKLALTIFPALILDLMYAGNPSSEIRSYRQFFNGVYNGIFLYRQTRGRLIKIR